jgi:methylmalonyl-CoA/ethylmalonyl-CoA epimerase
VGPNITQFAFSIKDMDAVSDYWERLGWPKIEVTKPTLTDMRYRGQPSDSVAYLGWHRHAAVPYEWILSIKGPNVYEDHLRKHGEGVHHIAFNTDDMDREVARWEAAGYVTSQSGGWGEKGKAARADFPTRIRNRSAAQTSSCYGTIARASAVGGWGGGAFSPLHWDALGIRRQ